MPADTEIDLGVPLSGNDLQQAKTYRLFIQLSRDLSLPIGRLGRFFFPAGRYVYTGSAKRNMIARLRRHLADKKKRHWHIDYLLAPFSAKITRIELSILDECILNQLLTGDVLAPGFGASDCKSDCNSHLRYLGQL